MLDICISIEPCHNQFWVLWQWPLHGPLLTAMDDARLTAIMSSLKSYMFVLLLLNHYNVTSIDCTSLLQSSYHLKLTPRVYFFPYRRRMYNNMQQSMHIFIKNETLFSEVFLCVHGNVCDLVNSLACSFIMIYHAYSGSYLRGLGSVTGQRICW
jgi:hypothetical protein